MDTTDAQKIIDWLGGGSINIFGSPFAGKDTQAHKLAEALGASVIGGGDILRAHHDQATIKRLMSSGELFPSDYYLGLVLPFLKQSSLKHKPLILSTVGRWHGEEDAVMQAAAQSGHPLKAVIFLRLDEAEMWRRFETNEKLMIRGKRHDDDAEVLKIRINEFQTKTLPVIEFYKHKKLLIEVSGEGAPDLITQQIIEKLLSFS